MISLANKTEKYLDSLFSNKIKLNQYIELHNIPFYIKKSYDFYTGNFHTFDFMLMYSKSTESFSISQIIKHIDQCKKAINTYQNIICVFEQLTNYQRNRLIDQNIEFIVPDKYLYAPNLGLAFSDLPTPSPLQVKTLSRSSQIIYFKLLNTNLIDLTQSDFAYSHGFSKMTVSRAFKELETIGVLSKEKIGRKNTWTKKEETFEHWKNIRSYFSNPISKKIYLHEINKNLQDNFIIAGESALSKKSLLGDPGIKSFAISRDFYENNKNKFDDITTINEANYCIEIWKYDVPTLKESIHPLALDISLNDNNDERIQLCLDDLLTNCFEEVPMYD